MENIYIYITNYIYIAYNHIILGTDDTSVKHKTLVGVSAIAVNAIPAPGRFKPPACKAIF